MLVKKFFPDFSEESEQADAAVGQQASVIIDYKWQEKLCDPSLTRSIPEHLTDEYHNSATKIYGFTLL